MGAAGLVIWTDWNGEKFAFCSRLCLGVHRAYLADPTMSRPPLAFMPIFGCWWCGKDLVDAIDWLADPCDPGIVRIEEGHDEDPLEPA